MLLAVYLTLTVLAFALMALSMLRHEAFMFELTGMVSALLFLSLGFLSYNIETDFCSLTTLDAWSCHTVAYTEPALSLMFYAIGISMLIFTLIMAIWHAAGKAQSAL